MATNATRRVRLTLYKWGNTPLVRLLASIRLTVVGLLLLFGLILAGTLYQVDHGIYAAQRRFFHSWFIMMGPLPIPGAQTLFWVLGINLLAALVFKVRLIWTNLGLIVIHIGLIVLLLGGLQTHYTSRYTVLGLAEGEEAGVSVDPLRWELYVAEGDDLASIPLSGLRPGTAIQTPSGMWDMRVSRTLPNSAATIDDAGIVTGLDPLRGNVEANLNIPGLVLSIGATGGEVPVAIHGSQLQPTVVEMDGRSLALRLSRTVHPLPARIRLLDFKAEFYPGSDIPKSFESHVMVTEETIEREAHISMNRPLRLRGHTFYQTSYGTDPTGRQLSVLAVVRNPGRVVPYLSSLLIFAGLVLHPFLRREGREGRAG